MIETGGHTVLELTYHKPTSAVWHQFLEFGSLRWGRICCQRQAILSPRALGNVQVGMTGMCL